MPTELSLSPAVAARVKCLTNVLHFRVIRAFFPYDRPKSAMEKAAEAMLKAVEDTGDYSRRFADLEKAVCGAFREIGAALGRLALDVGLPFDVPEIILLESRDKLYTDSGVGQPWDRLPNYRRAALARGFQAGREMVDMVLGTSVIQPQQEKLELSAEPDARVQGLPFPNHEAKPAKLKVWKGNDREFGDYVLGLFDKGRISGAETRTAALRIMCGKYRRKDGSQMVPRNILSSLNARKNDQTP